ncbi:MAG TPA: diguanylate cyclase [Methylophaga aminisulfidivorans]|uniref:diguanylate cyclase n=2 Tax=root TaxID=1 RepID=A0A7C1VR10_9GAMM|nr:diguanylate cyclase [Methylophaga aminisulfidivorans]
MNVLIADDDPTIRLTLSSLLSSTGCDLMEAANGEDALAIIDSENSPELILLDWNMPGLSGVEVTRRLRAGSQENRPYIIIVSSYHEPLQIIEALDAGADDFITKPIDGRFLKAKYNVAERILTAQNKLNQANKVLERLAYFDELTGVMNRRAGMVSVEIELERCLRSRDVLAVAMLDIDFFKRVNDSLGHIAGDEVLHEFATKIHAELRPYDVICRYGGEEFFIAASMKHEAECERLFERLRLAIENMVFNNYPELKITTSIGVFIDKPVEQEDVKSLVEKADKALYKAKESGRNKVIIERKSDNSPPVV